MRGQRSQPAHVPDHGRGQDEVGDDGVQVVGHLLAVLQLDIDLERPGDRTAQQRELLLGTETKLKAGAMEWRYQKERKTVVTR